jgi:hypothetical protein
MWAIDNRTPYAADRTWIRDAEGAEVWIVAVKATYDVLPDGSTRISSKQVPVNSGPMPHPGLKSLLYDTDLGPPKTATDIVLAGHAYSQDGLPVTELPVGFRVGALSRAARVFGNRSWQRSLLGTVASKPEPFTRMPLVYERAFGGDDIESKRFSGNPLGRGIKTEADDRIWLPNIESIESPIRNPGSFPPVVGFGPIPSHWPRRRQYAGTYDDDWIEHRRPLLPKDLDARFWQIAPPEQQIAGHLKGGETIVLANLTPARYVAHGRLAFTLPKLTLAFQTYFFDGTMERSRATIHTLVLEPDRPRVSVVYHMALPCHPKVNLLDRTLVTQKIRPLDREAGKIDDEFLWPEAPAPAEERSA